MYVEKAYSSLLLITIRPSVGDVKTGGPLGVFREEQAMSWHRVSPSFFLSSPSLATQLHYPNNYTYSHPNLNFLQYTIQILVPQLMWSAQPVRDSKIDHIQRHLSALRGPEACNGSVVWHWNTYTFKFLSRNQKEYNYRIREVRSYFVELFKWWNKLHISFLHEVRVEK